MGRKKSSGAESTLGLVFVAVLGVGFAGRVLLESPRFQSVLDAVVRYTVAAVVSVVVLWVAVRWLPPLVRWVRMRRYFGGEEFRRHRAEVAAVVAERNEVAGYAEEVRERGLFEVGASSAGSQAHLASSVNTSRHNYRRDRNVRSAPAPNVHEAGSLRLVQSASREPLKYVMKYFGISADDESLKRVEELGGSIASLEGAVANVQGREAAMMRSINPPRFIQKHYREKFLDELGAVQRPIMVPYPEYVFEYVSPGGNSSQRTEVTLDGKTIDALIELMSEKIKFRKSAAGQRALMTAKLRRFIKDRDGHACKHCDVSVDDEPHLLLEVDHITPVSRGGLSTPDNLQTLCWRCNRTKGAKLTV